MVNLEHVFWSQPPFLCVGNIAFNLLDRGYMASKWLLLQLAYKSGFIEIVTCCTLFSSFPHCQCVISHSFLLITIENSNSRRFRVLTDRDYIRVAALVIWTCIDHGLLLELKVVVQVYRNSEQKYIHTLRFWDQIFIKTLIDCRRNRSLSKKRMKNNTIASSRFPSYDTSVIVCILFSLPR